MNIIQQNEPKVNNQNKSTYIVVTDCQSKYNDFDQALTNSACPNSLFITNTDFDVDYYRKIPLNKEQTYVNSFGAQIKFYITDKCDEIEKQIKSNQLKIEPFIDCFFNKAKTLKEETNYLSQYLKMKHKQDWDLYHFTLLFTEELNQSIYIMLLNTGKFHHKSLKEIDNAMKQINNSLNKSNTLIDKAYSSNELYKLLKDDNHVVKYHNKVWFLNNKKWGYTDYDKKLWLENKFLQDVNDNSVKVRFVKDTMDFLDNAIYLLLNDSQYPESEEQGYFDKYNHYFDNDNKEYQIYEHFIYKNKFTTNKINIDLDNVMFPNQNTINKVNIFLDHLTNNDEIIKDTLLNAMSSILINDSQLREKMTPGLILYGPSNTGKSTLVKLFKRLLDKEIIESKSIKLKNTELFSLIDKRGIIFDDTKAFNHPDAALDGNVGEMLGGFINGDNREVKELYKQDMVDMKLQLMPIIVTNYKPIITTVNMKRRTIFIKLNNNVDDQIYKDSLTLKEIESEDFLEGFAYILFQHLNKMLSDKNIYNYSKNEAFKKFYHINELQEKQENIIDGNWSSDLRLLFKQLEIESIDELIFIKQNELYNFYLQNNLGNKTLSEFSNEFEINGFQFDRIGITCKDGQRITTINVLKYNDKQKQKEKLNYMKENVIASYVDQNTGEIINDKHFGDNKETIKQYSLKNIN